MRTFLASLVLLSSASCADGIDHHSGDFELRIQETRGEVDRHHSAVFAIQSVDDVPAETRRHGERMLSLMDRMHDSIDVMSHCSTGTRGSMRKMMGAMETDLDEHFSSLGAANTLDEVRSGCVMHVETMTSSLDAMQDRAMRTACMRRW